MPLLIIIKWNLGLSLLGVITFSDEDPVVQAQGLRAAYSSSTLTASRSRVAGILRISRGEVLLLKNYNDEVASFQYLYHCYSFIFRFRYNPRMTSTYSHCF